MSRDLIRDFKGDLNPSLPLHPLETALIWVMALNVCSLPWMLGGMRPWAQFISLGLSILALGLALIPRTYDGNLVRDKAFRTYPHKKLLRWPLFWVGLIFFSYVLIQALNPAWEFVQKPTSWTMRPINHIEWLPSGMITPLETMNTWRQLIIWLAPFFVAAAAWTGFTRRRAVIRFLIILTGNAVVLSIVGVVSRITANGQILWLIEGGANYSFASFIYKNHAGTFFALQSIVSMGLTVHFARRARRNRGESNPAIFFGLASVFLAVAVLMTFSRGATLLLGGVVGIITIYLAIGIFQRSGVGRSLVLFLVLICGVAVLGLISAPLVDYDRTMTRLMRLVEEDSHDQSVLKRKIAWEAGLDMASERPYRGWGAGGFRFLFPKYQVSRPEITYHIHPSGVRQFAFWEHLHNDYLQFLIELGRIGSSLLLLAFFTGFRIFIQNKGHHSPDAFILFTACMLALGHAAFDFPLQNPAVLTTFATLFVLSITLPRLAPS